MVSTGERMASELDEDNKMTVGRTSITNGIDTELRNGNTMELSNLLDYGESNEIRIPVPYGHIAAKEWGPKNGEPVLGLHGWQDNASTFDNVISYLPDTIHLIVIDLPGHGLSSHLPVGSVYGASQFLIDVRRVVNYLGWKKFSFLAHSLGAYLAIYYSAIHPDQVYKLASIDILYPGLKMRDATTVRKFLDTALKEEANEFEPQQRMYTYEDAWELMWQRRDGMTKEGAIPLMTRACQKTDGGFVFTRDHRLKAFVMQPWEFVSEEAIFYILKNFSAKTLVIVATESSIFKLHGDLQGKTQALFAENCSSFKRVDVNGSHFVHLVKPEVVGPILRDFFTE